MADLAFILMMGAVASILVLTIAPLSLVYLAAFVTLTPILGIALWRSGILFLEAAIGVVDALRLGTRARVSDSGLMSPPVVDSSPEVLPALPAGEPEPDDESSAAEPVLDAASVPELTAEPRPDSPSDSGEIERGEKEDQSA